jgi:hypothetical protein
MQEDMFEIGAPGIDTEQIVGDIRRTVEEKTEAGLYPDPVVAQAERHNVEYLRDHSAFVAYYMDCLRQAAFVDINDFEIREHRSVVAPLLVVLKRVLWGLLKFYTYRLWSQQNDVNGLLVTGIEGVDGKCSARLEALEQRVAALEEQQSKGAP